MEIQTHAPEGDKMTAKSRRVFDDCARAQKVTKITSRRLVDAREKAEIEVTSLLREHKEAERTYETLTNALFECIREEAKTIK